MKSSRESLYKAVREKDITELKRLINKNVDVNAWNNCKDPILTTASEGGHLEIVQLLIEAGADVNAQDDDGYTALIIASFIPHIEVVKLLIEAGSKEY